MTAFLNSLFLVTCAVLVVVPPWFVVNRVYEDGLIGRIGLLGIAFTAAMFILGWFDYDRFPAFPYDIPFPGVLMALFTAWFLCWHLVRFHHRVVLREKIGDAKAWVR